MTGLVVGTRLDGEALVVPNSPRVPHMLVGGLSGGGKSVFISCILAELAALKDMALIGIDLKVVELSPWVGRFTTVATDMAAADRLIGQLRTLVSVRRDLLTSLGMRFWDPRLGPWVVVVIDELAELLGIDPGSLSGLVGVEADDPEEVKRVSDRLNQALQYGQRSQKARMSLLGSLARVCRFCGITLIAATQYPSAETVDQQLRTQLDLRVMMRVVSDEQVRVILGSGYGIKPESIPSREVGGLWIQGLPGEPVPVRARSFDITDAAIAHRVAQTAHLRIDSEALFADCGVTA